MQDIYEPQESEDKEMDELDFKRPKKIVGKLISVEVLDKIRAEIEEHAKFNQSLNIEKAKALYWCLAVIDKYREEIRNEVN